MLELAEKRFLLTTEDGILISCYSSFEDAKLDGEDLAKGTEGMKFVIMENILKNKLGTNMVQYTYEQKVTLPEEKEEEVKEEEGKEGESAKEEGGKEGESAKEEGGKEGESAKEEEGKEEGEKKEK